MEKFLAVFFGLVSMAGGVLLVIFVWGPLVLNFVLACIPLVLFFGGMIAFLAGISSMKDASRVKKLEEEPEVKTEEEPNKE